MPEKYEIPMTFTTWVLKTLDVLNIRNVKQSLSLLLSDNKLVVSENSKTTFPRLNLHTYPNEKCLSQLI